MKTRMLRDIEVSAVGLGCMGFSHGYGPGPDHKEAIRLIRHAVDLGCTHFDTAESYGSGANEILVGEALKPVRDQVVIATKLRVLEPASQKPVEQQIREHLEASLKRLGTDHVELYYLHRVNPQVPVEEVAEGMGKLIREGKIRGWGQSQSTSEEIRRAHAVTPIAAIQSEYSLMERMFERDVLPLCKELNIGFVAFSPTASGFLAGKTRAGDNYVGDDVRRAITRFDDKNVKANQPLIDLLQRIAKKHGVTTVQLSLAWMLAKWPFVTPIPGSRNTGRIMENLGAADVSLTADDLAGIEKELAKITVHGNRTDEDIAKLRATPEQAKQPMADEPTNARKSFGDIAPHLAEITDKMLFGDVWENPALSSRDRSLVTITSLISLYRVNEMPFHLKKALDNGLTREEIIGVITHLAFYAGWPPAMTALSIARKVFEEVGE